MIGDAFTETSMLRCNINQNVRLVRVARRLENWHLGDWSRSPEPRLIGPSQRHSWAWLLWRSSWRIFGNLEVCRRVDSSFWPIVRSAGRVAGLLRRRNGQTHSNHRRAKAHRLESLFIRLGPSQELSKVLQRNHSPSEAKISVLIDPHEQEVQRHDRRQSRSVRAFLGVDLLGFLHHGVLVRSQDPGKGK